MNEGTDYYAVHAEGVEETMDSLGDALPQLTWNDQSYRCLPSAREKGSGLTEGGFGLSGDLTATLLAEDFGVGPFPQSEQFILYPTGTQFQFRITSVSREPGGNLLRIRAVAANQL